MTRTELRAEFMAHVFRVCPAPLPQEPPVLVEAARDSFHEDPDTARIVASMGGYRPPDSCVGSIAYGNGVVAQVHRLGFFDAVMRSAAILELANAAIPQDLYRRRTINDIAGTRVCSNGTVYDTSTKFGLSFYVQIEDVVVAYALANQQVVSADGVSFSKTDAVYASLLCVDARFQRTVHHLGPVLSALVACAAEAHGHRHYFAATSAHEQNAGVRHYYERNGLRPLGEPSGHPPMLRYTADTRVLMERRLANLARTLEAPAVQSVAGIVAAINPRFGERALLSRC